MTHRLLVRALASATPLFVLGACAGYDDTEQTFQAITVCHSTTVEGVDVSTYQGGSIDWNAVHASGRQFAITRISDGTSGLDGTFSRNWSGIRAAGMIRGAYQFFEPGEDPAAQARIVVSAVGRLGAGDLPVTADMEVSGGQSAATIVAHLQTWMAAVTAGTGKVPIIYTGPYFWRDSVGGSTAFSHSALWNADYTSGCPIILSGWSDWQMWQYTDGTCSGCPSVGTVPGIGQSCDRDRFAGTLADLQTFANGGADWGAQYVMQSWPLAADAPIMMTAGSTQTIWIELKNIGSHAWDANTRIATTGPRDRVSPFAGSDWIRPDRPAGVPAGMSIAPGANYRFQWTLHAPAMPGHYDEHVGVVEDTVAWFSDPGQAGPPDDDIEAVIVVTAGDASTPTSDASDDAASDDAGGDDAMPPPHIVNTGDAGSDGARDGAGDGSTHEMPMGGCGCTVPAAGDRRAPLGAAASLLALGAIAGRRRRAKRS